MTNEQQDRDRAERDRDRSEEAHWQVAETAAEAEEDLRSEAARDPGEQQPEWEDEGGALDREP